MLIGLSVSAQDSADPKSPLDQLRERSAEFRWRQQRHQWLSPADNAPNGNVPPTAADDTDEPADAKIAGGQSPAIIPDSDARNDESEVNQGVGDSPTRIASIPAWAEDRVADANSAPPAPPRERTEVASQPVDTTQGADSMAARDPFPFLVEAIQLSDFLAGADPVQLVPRQNSMRYLSRNSRMTDSQLINVQDQSIVPLATRERGVLRPITEINPFYDYLPTGYDPENSDPCKYLCPTPSSICEGDTEYLCPDEEELPQTRSADRYFAHMNYYWAASNVYHNPLYFEDPQLERYGHVHVHDAVQPLYSMARFGTQLIGLPYQMALNPVHDREYPLGYYRPGDPAPKLIYQPPLNARAGAVAAGIYTGLFFLVP